jgi:hypothetical protein
MARRESSSKAATFDSLGFNLMSGTPGDNTMKTEARGLVTFEKRAGKRSARARSSTH